MANNTDPGFDPAGQERSGQAGTTASGTVGIPNTPPFGDPDQRLYGGTGMHSVVKRPPAAQGDPAYEGRHRRAE